MNDHGIKLATGRERALAREAQKALFLMNYYEDMEPEGNARAEKRRLQKAMKKHDEQMALRARRRYA